MENKTKGENTMSKFTDIINGDKPVLIDFSAEWCAPCRMMPPILKDVKKQLGDKVRILKIDVDRNPAIAQKYMIRSVPTLMVFKKGEVLFSQPGVIPAAQLAQIVGQFVD
jgi:thioredoxin 1